MSRSPSSVLPRKTLKRQIRCTARFWKAWFRRKMPQSLLNNAFAVYVSSSATRFDLHIHPNVAVTRAEGCVWGRGCYQIDVLPGVLDASAVELHAPVMTYDGSPCQGVTLENEDGWKDGWKVILLSWKLRDIGAVIGECDYRPRCRRLF